MPYIYGLTDPDGSVRYIGQCSCSLDRRRKGRLSWRDRSHRTKWIVSLIEAGQEPGIKLIAEFPEELIDDAETALIEYHWQCGDRLTNTLLGGRNGARGNYQAKSPEHRAKLAAILRASAEKRRGVPLKQEHKEKIWSKNMNRPRNDKGQFA